MTVDFLICLVVVEQWVLNVYQEVAECVFVDNNKESIDVIKQNINGAKVSDRAEVMSCDVTSAISKLAQRGKTFDVIFMDPPYDKGLVRIVFTGYS